MIATRKHVEEAAAIATKFGGRFYHKGDSAAPLMGANAVYFFESWDNECMDFYYELHARGFRDVEYRAPYHWKVQNNEVSVTYIEGDVYLTALDSTKV